MKYSDIRIVENEKEFTALVITTNGTKIDIPNIPKSYISSKARLKTAIDKLIARYNSMQNVLNLHSLIMNTMKDTIWKGLKNNTNDNIDKGLYYLPRQNDPEFPTGVSFEYTVGGKKFKINDIKEEIGIDLVVNTKNPKKDKYGYTHAEGWPVYMNEWDDMKQITIDAVNAREHISTVGPPAPEQKVDGPLRIAISPKTFYYRNATVVDTDNN